MGGQESSSRKKIDHRGYLDGWQTIDHLSNFNLVQNLTTNQLGEARRYKLDYKLNPKDELQIYQLRKISNQPIVRAYSSQLLQMVSRKKSKQQNPGICSTNNHIGVVTQHIPHLLHDLPQLTFPESLYLLKQSLRGYEHLYPKSGPVHVTDKMIGINDQGHAKIWINQNFAQNHPNLQIRSLLSTRNQKLDRQYNMIAPQYRDQKEMVQNITDVIQQKCQQGIFPSQFRAALKENSHSFQNVKAFVDNYIQSRGIFIPNRLHERLVRLTPRQYQQSRRRSMNKIDHNISRSLSQHRLPTQSELYTLPKTQHQLGGFNYNAKSPPQITNNNKYQIQNNFVPNYQTNQIRPVSNINLPTYQAQPLVDQTKYGHTMPNFGTNPQLKINFGNRQY